MATALKPASSIADTASRHPATGFRVVGTFVENRNGRAMGQSYYSLSECAPAGPSASLGDHKRRVGTAVPRCSDNLGEALPRALPARVERHTVPRRSDTPPHPPLRRSG